MKKVIKYLVIEKIDNKNEYYLRMTSEMQDDIGTVSYLQFKNTDKKQLKEDDVFLALEASKAILNLKMPLDATVVEWNKQALEDPKLISSHDEKVNWIMILSDIDQQKFESLEDF
ncbi:glycine cleavage system protein H [Mycoplasma capricolum subsp. capricolum]|uniref:glycine cleavage system protein H n=1 Tax=Mycoplasma capricolum TaxID=2095 RepID=UPI003DA68EC9